ncbi:class I SAM-dependent methyltransferase [Actinoplanes sp. NPDC051861]|uniref:class I SAM-dependent methyltransferase n=1 Tax=Actinoplanes sp. NPDC051861 TaxID=3155170 RepID=UPI00341C3DBE
MTPTAAYDEIADWYEFEFLPRGSSGDPLGIRSALATLLGPGSGRCLEIGCGTGVHAAQIRDLGWMPLGLDLSAGMLHHARDRLPAALADATRLPVADASVDAVVTVMAHTDMPGYPDVLHEVARVLRPGGRFVHIGVHPCFCGGFADRGDPEAVVIRPGYRDGHWTTASWTDQGVRDKVGASHWSLPALLNAFLAAGLTFEEFTEGGEPTPVMLAVRAHSSTSRNPTPPSAATMSTRRESSKRSWTT